MDVSIKYITLKDEPNMLAFNLYGTNVNYILANTIRRTIMTLIPTYAFNRQHTNVKINDHDFNNHFIYEKIESLPLYNVIDLDVIKSDDYKNLKTNNEYKIVIDEKHNGQENKYITTHNIKLYINDKLVDDKNNEYLKRPPILITTLKKNQSIMFESTSQMGIAKTNVMWAVTPNPFYEEIDDNTFFIAFKTKGHMTNENILYCTFEVLIHKFKEKINMLKDDYLTNEYKNKKEITIIFDKECDTLGAIIEYVLQNNNKISKAGYSKNHYLIYNVELCYYLANGVKDHPIQILIDSFEYLIELMTKLQTQVNKKMEK